MPDSKEVKKNMRLTKAIQVEDFLKAAHKAKDNVYLRSIYGDCYNLKSALSAYVAMGALLGEHGDELELFCDSREDEGFFVRFFKDHPEVL